MSWSDAPLLDIELERLTTLADGRQVEWEAIGNGEEPLVWVEGGPGVGAHVARADVVAVLDRFRCHLVNIPGSGRSTPPIDERGYDLEAVADFYEDWRRTLALAPVTVMGHSWGGLVGPAWAALHPEGVRRVIVIDGYAGGGSVGASEATAERQRALDRVADRPWFAAAVAASSAVDDATSLTEAEAVEAMRAFMPLYFADPEEPVSARHVERLRRELRIDPSAGAAWSGWREAADYRPLLARVACPTLVLVGEHDWICGPVWNRALAAAIPGAQLVEFAGVGHLPQYEVPSAVRDAIDRWIAETG